GRSLAIWCLQSRCQSHITPARFPTCKKQPSAEAFGPASQIQLLSPHLPFANSELSPAQN
ncbi:hypothetical protein JOQ06_018235, partial [Pogonophryne albipinna]